MRNILLVGQDSDFADSVEKAIAGGDFAYRRITDGEEMSPVEAEKSISVVGLLFPGDDASIWERALSLSRRIAHTNTPLAVFAGDLSVKDRIRLFELGAKECFSRDIDPEELNARLHALAETKASLDRLRDKQLEAVLAERELKARVEQIDKQMRLARRLQRDFLPREMPQVPGVRFAAQFEPAGWVAGDFYDIFRLDEDNVGFYVADVAGHGMEWPRRC